MVSVVILLVTTCAVSGAATAIIPNGPVVFLWGISSESFQQIHWSPYVHGLVSDEYYYSPYAFKYGQTGLVSRYDGKPYRRQNVCAPIVVAPKRDPGIDFCLMQEKRYQENVAARRRLVEQRKREAAARAAARAE
jgi:hypothetical protein